jgi:hypothetical protein
LIIHHGTGIRLSHAENKRDYPVGRGKPPVHTRFKKGQSGNPRGPRAKNLPALWIEALDAPAILGHPTAQLAQIG